MSILLKYSAEQLNTLVNFESALLGLDGQFSVGVNISGCAHAPQCCGKGEQGERQEGAT